MSSGSSSSCPSMPTNQADCTKAGKNWCSSSYGSGWCSIDVCQPMAPSGQMTCPDGKSFVTSFDKCPRKSTTTPITPPVIDPPNPEYQSCANGTRVPKGTPCPVEKTIICANGTKVLTMAECVTIDIKKDEIALCLNAGNTWCTDASGQSKGWCAAKGMTCSSTIIHPPGPDPFPVPPVRQLTSRELRDLERTRSNNMRELNEMERNLKRAKNTELIPKVTALKTKLTDLKFVDNNAFEDLRSISDEISDLRYALDEVLGGYDSRPELDEKMQKRALADMKRGAKSFLSNLQAKKLKLDQLKKQGVPVDAALTEILNQGIDMAKQMATVKTYDEAREIMESIPDIAEKMNDLLPQIEILSRLPRALALVDREMVATNKVVNQATALAKRRKFADLDQIQKMQDQLSEARAALAEVRKGAVATDDVLEFVQSDVIDKLHAAREIADGVIAISNAKVYVNGLNARSKQYAARIKKLSAAGEDVFASQEALTELTSEIKRLQLLLNSKFTIEVAEDILSSLDGIGDLVADLENELGLTKVDVLKEQIRKTLEGGGESFEPIEVDDLEKLIVKAHRLTRFAADL